MVTIPRGKEVKLAINGNPVLADYPSARMILSTDITISLQSRFESLLGDTSSKLIQILSGITESTTGVGLSGKFKEQGYQIWAGTDPVSFAFSIKLNMYTSGKTDVVEPAKLLCQLPLPYLDDNSVGLVAPGPSVLSAMGYNAKYEQSCSFRCGIFYLPQVIITTAEPTFSTECDEDGYPIWCDIKFDVISIYTATRQLISKFGYGLDSNETKGTKY